MSDGWIKLHRQFRDNPIYRNSHAVHIWNECLLVAAHQGFKIDYCGNEYNLNPGEFVFGRIAWSQRLKIHETTLNGWIKKFIKREMLEVILANRGQATIYRVKNWGKYQISEEQRTGSRTGEWTGSGQVADTNKKDKKVNNEIPINQGLEINIENQINELLKLFQGVNPTSYKLYSNKTQRAALLRLIDNFGKEKIEYLLKSLPAIVGQKYAPKITTPLQLEERMGELMLFAKQQKNINSKFSFH